MHLVECQLECFKISCHSDDVTVKSANFEFMITEIIPNLIFVSLSINLLLDRVNIDFLSKSHKFRIKIP
jgi:hypothetical protein